MYQDEFNFYVALYNYNLSVYYVVDYSSQNHFVIELLSLFLEYYLGFLFLASIPLCIYFEYKLLRLKL